MILDTRWVRLTLWPVYNGSLSRQGRFYPHSTLELELPDWYDPARPNNDNMFHTGPMRAIWEQLRADFDLDLLEVAVFNRRNNDGAVGMYFHRPPRDGTQYAGPQ